MKIYKGNLYYLELFVTDQNGDPVTGLTTSYTIYKSSDNSLVGSGSLTDVGNGVYQKSYTFNTIGQFRVVYTSPTTYTDEIETILVVDTQVLATAKLDRILGLCQENYRIINPVYNKYGDLTEGLIKIYANANDVDTDTNPIAIYQIDTTYGAGKEARHVTGYKVKKIL